MFGFILPSLESLNDNEKQRYHAVYCGVCQSLKERYGQACRLTVSYDLTFMVLVLGSLYEPQEQSGAKRCPVHPCNPQQYVRSELSDYAADLSVALAYHKLMDNWYDDHSRLSRSGAAVLRGAYKKAKQRRPKSCATIETAMAEIRRLEQMADARALGALGEQAAGVQAAGVQVSVNSPEANIVSPDAPANCFGLMLGDLFVYKDDFWSTDLRRFGARLGKFVYVMDAAMDLEEDLKAGSYNPFKGIEHDTQTLRENLEFLAAGMTDAFERLPLERDLHLMRSVLYAGVWQRFEAKEKKTHHE